MPQDKDTGAAGDAFGRDTARKVAKAIGATMARPGSNEADRAGRRIVIKCAKAGNNQVGVTYSMLARLDAVIAAFQRSDSRFDLYELASAVYQQQMSPTRSLGSFQGKGGMVSRATFESLGKHLGTISV
jgi:hypothetical protein